MKTPARFNLHLLRTSFPFLLGSLLAVSGCGQRMPVVSPDAVRADTPDERLVTGRAELDARAFYPVAIGNRWHYRSVLTFDVLNDADPPEEFSEALEIEQVGFETLLGRTYFVEEERYGDSSAASSARYRYRQDQSGLYNLDPIDAPHTASAADQETPADILSRLGLFHSAERALARIDDPTKRAAYRSALARLSSRSREETRAASGPGGRITSHRPGGVESGEITVLSYPLHTGQHWIIRADPRFEATVEGHDVLDLPAGRFNGWRRAIRSELFGPNDRVLFWTGRDGYLALHAHLEQVGTDPNGNTQTEIFEQTVRLDGIDLVDQHGRP